MLSEFSGVLHYDEEDPSAGNSFELVSTFSECFQSAEPSVSRVFIHAGKSIQAVCAVYSAFLSKVPYVPADVLNPLERVINLYEQIQPGFVFIDEKTPFFQEYIALRKYNVLWKHSSLLLIEIASVTDIAHDPSLACILFTSGSTGTPKGVMLSQKNLLTFADWAAQCFGVNESSRLLSVSPLHFDLSVFDIYNAFRKKARLFITPPDLLLNPLFLAEYIYNNRINVIYATPSWFNLLLLYGKTSRFDFSFVKTLLLAGEPFKTELALKLHEVFPAAQISNLYGPTETNVCTWYTIDFNTELLHRNGIISIGNACPYATLRFTPQHVVEVAGDSVMMGYWPSLKDSDWYNTGDVVETDPATGLLYYAGRNDNLIKRNGYRIEPGEIESCLAGYQGIKLAAVTAHRQSDKTTITAHLVTDGKAPAVMELREHCLRHLPPYMLPDDYRFHQEFPYTSSGKIDYIRLTTNGTNG